MVLNIHENNKYEPSCDNLMPFPSTEIDFTIKVKLIEITIRNRLDSFVEEAFMFCFINGNTCCCRG